MANLECRNEPNGLVRFAEKTMLREESSEPFLGRA